MTTVRVSVPRKRKRKDPVFAFVRNATDCVTIELVTFGQTRDIPSKEQDARQQNNQDKTYEARQGCQVGLGMSTQGQESITDVQNMISRSFKNKGECCILCRSNAAGPVQSAQLR